MAELKWEHGDGEHDAGRHMIFEGPNESHGVQYTVTTNLRSLEEAYRIAQLVENLLDPPECPTHRGWLDSLSVTSRGPGGNDWVHYRPKHCPDCGALLGGSHD